ncbi:MAG: NAD(P)H-dependent oxidoreductase [Bacteroidia bacterium]|nr:NAD(P)H-dependent oxidoreductase [Bacteroidia bacterium]
MHPKHILIINGHPTKDSYCQALSEAYALSAKKNGHEVRMLNLYDLNFDPNFKNGYSKKETPVPDILKAQEFISWAHHLVLVHPVWWGSVPALLKGFFDATLLPGFAFKYKKDSVWWDKLLTGRTAHIIYTSDTPVWVYKYFFGQPSVSQIKRRTLQFCGINKVKVTGIGPIRKSKEAFRRNWLKKIGELGLKAA